MTARHRKIRSPRDRDWQCPCGAKTGLLVVRTEKAEDGNPIRLRRCRNCKTVVATEEVVFPVDAFYFRAASIAQRLDAKRRWLARSRRKSEMATCKRCGALYNIGRYSRHVRKPHHLAALRFPVSEKELEGNRKRAYRRYWLDQGIDVTKRGSQHALADISKRPDRLLDRVEDSSYATPA